MKIQFKFHTDGFAKTAQKIEEPEESLEELLKDYEESCKRFSEFKQKSRELENRYRSTRINAQGKVESYIDYDAWEKDDNDSFWKFGLADFNGFNALDMMQDMIDAKTYYMNQREQED